MKQQMVVQVLTDREKTSHTGASLTLGLRDYSLLGAPAPRGCSAGTHNRSVNRLTSKCDSEYRSVCVAR